MRVLKPIEKLECFEKVTIWGGGGSFPTTDGRRIPLTITAIGFTHLIISK